MLNAKVCQAHSIIYNHSLKSVEPNNYLFDINLLSFFYCCLLLHKIIHNTFASPLKELLVISTHNYNTRRVNAFNES